MFQLDEQNMEQKIKWLYIQKNVQHYRCILNINLRKAEINNVFSMRAFKFRKRPVKLVFKIFMYAFQNFYVM